MKGILFAVIVAVFSCSAEATTPGWGELSWLLGQWTAEGGGSQLGSGGFAFTQEVGGQVLVRRNYAEYPSRDGNPAQRHDDLMVISRDGSATRAVYWDSEGHTIHYAVTSASPNDIAFVSDDPAGPRFRLSYHKTSTGLEGTFEIAPPNDRDHFSPYLHWTAHRSP